MSTSYGTSPISIVGSPIERFLRGGVIPAQPLALTAERKLDERRQQALSRYQIEAGSLGIAVAVHSTQFAIHDVHSALLEPVLALVAETAAEYPERRPLLVAGVAGSTTQAVAEAQIAASLGYDLVLLSTYGAGDLTEHQLLERARAVGEVLPVIGFYLQRAVGGRYLSREFWQRLAEIPNVVGIKIAPFDRYATLDVIHGVGRSGRAADVALYTGNDDHIIMDLLTSFPTQTETGAPIRLEVVGGLLGQWAVWVKNAVEIMESVARAKAGDRQALDELIALNPALTDANGVIFDAAHRFAGCIPGIHEVLRRQGLLEGLWLLDEHEQLTPGQFEEIDRIWAAYPELRDDAFIAENLDRWLR
ncbi:dihydrodipicolinate synthase family protein [Microbacterium sp.]|uniref:dihydrodipicolinate synthase family protein n=1 Tax=Microbacterium sp. TaxID=51671 RepID=UPI002733AA0A|nr:dihydrodipicolinate synthase family protein [Microbacterium sp.]MDP3951388.1 dihydrodipicolinate synthase family protein [Microbacterium sp.]